MFRGLAAKGRGRLVPPRLASRACRLLPPSAHPGSAYRLVYLPAPLYVDSSHLLPLRSPSSYLRLYPNHSSKQEDASGRSIFLEDMISQFQGYRHLHGVGVAKECFRAVEFYYDAATLVVERIPFYMFPPDPKLRLTDAFVRFFPAFFL